MYVSYVCSSLLCLRLLCAVLYLVPERVVVLLLVGVSGFIGVCVRPLCISLLSVFLCPVGFCSPGCLCVLGFCVFGVFFGVLGGCLWGVFFVFWCVSGVLFCWGGGFWVDFLFGRCGSIVCFVFWACALVGERLGGLCRGCYVWRSFCGWFFCLCGCAF